MAGLACVGFAGSYHRRALQHRLVGYHLGQTIVGHVADNSGESFTSTLRSLSNPCGFSQDCVRIGRICEADYFSAGSMKDGVYQTLLFFQFSSRLGLDLSLGALYGAKRGIALFL